jgi:hypothetical protein
MTSPPPTITPRPKFTVDTTPESYRTPFLQNYRLHFHTIAALFSLLSHFYLLTHIRAAQNDLPIMRLPFARLAFTQENNIAMKFGYLAYFLQVLVVISHARLYSYYLLLEWDSHYMQRWRKQVYTFFVYFSFLFGFLFAGLCFQLSRIISWDEFMNQDPYFSLFQSTIFFILTSILPIIGFKVLPIIGIPFIDYKSNQNNQNNQNNQQNGQIPKKLTQKEKMAQKMIASRQERAKIAPLDPKNHQSVMAEFNERFFDDNVDMYGYNGVNVVPQSRFGKVDRDTDDSDEDHDEDDVDDDEDDEIDLNVDGIEGLIDEMSRVLGEGKEKGGEKKDPDAKKND